MIVCDSKIYEGWLGNDEKQKLVNDVKIRQDKHQPYGLFIVSATTTIENLEVHDKFIRNTLHYVKLEKGKITRDFEHSVSKILASKYPLSDIDWEYMTADNINRIKQKIEEIQNEYHEKYDSYTEYLAKIVWVFLSIVHLLKMLGNLLIPLCLISQLYLILSTPVHDTVWISYKSGWSDFLYYYDL